MPVPQVLVSGNHDEIRRWADSNWAVGVQPHLPLDYPLDHPDLEPVWRAADEAGMAVVHHSFATGYPGYRDLWDRASHVAGGLHATGIRDGDRVAIRLGNGLEWCVAFFGSLMAGAVVASLPIVVIYVWFLDYYVSCLTAGAVKG